MIPRVVLAMGASQSSMGGGRNALGGGPRLVSRQWAVGRFAGLCRAGRMWADSRGAAALEFALVAPLFLAIILASLQLALVYLGQEGLENAAEGSARLLQSGQPQLLGWDAGAYKRAACATLPPFMSCDRLSVDVTRVDDLADAASLPGASGSAYAPGGPDALVVVRLSYMWPTGAAPLGLNLADQAGGDRMLMATRLFRTEPYVAVAS